MSSDERQGPSGDGTGPWWSELGPVGGVVLIVVGVAAAVWTFLKLPGTPDFASPAYYGAGRALCVGVAVAGAALFTRSRTRSSRADETPDEDPESS
jgi:hypothetical protein